MISNWFIYFVLVLSKLTLIGVYRRPDTPLHFLHVVCVHGFPMGAQWSSNIRIEPYTDSTFTRRYIRRHEFHGLSNLIPDLKVDRTVMSNNWCYRLSQDIPRSNSKFAHFCRFHSGQQTIGQLLTLPFVCEHHGHFCVDACLNTTNFYISQYSIMDVSLSTSVKVYFRWWESSFLANIHSLATLRQSMYWLWVGMEHCSLVEVISLSLSLTWPVLRAG